MQDLQQHGLDGFVLCKSDGMYDYRSKHSDAATNDVYGPQTSRRICCVQMEAVVMSLCLVSGVLGKSSCCRPLVIGGIIVWKLISTQSDRRLFAHVQRQFSTLTRVQTVLIDTARDCDRHWGSRKRHVSIWKFN
jgi:hypothetical protein